MKEKEYNPNQGVLVCELKGVPEGVIYRDISILDGIQTFSLKLLARAINALIHADDLTITNENGSFLFRKEDYAYTLSEEEIKSFKVEPFWHQVEAINYGLHPSHKKWLLLDSMGLGKSATIMWLAETLKRRGQLDHCLIVCGVDSLRTN